MPTTSVLCALVLDSVWCRSGYGSLDFRIRMAGVCSGMPWPGSLVSAFVTTGMWTLGNCIDEPHAGLVLATGALCAEPNG